MSRSAWRIATDAPGYEAHDLTGAGAEATGGRWNPRGAAMVYASGSRALACLETVVHLNAGALPLNRYLIELTAPEELWRAAETHTPDTLPVGWDAEPPGRVSLGFGAAWLRERRSALLIAPSVLVPEEANVLLNPAHPDSRGVTARKLRRWTYDPRLSKAP